MSEKILIAKVYGNNKFFDKRGNIAEFKISDSEESVIEVFKDNVIQENIKGIKYFILKDGYFYGIYNVYNSAIISTQYRIGSVLSYKLQPSLILKGWFETGNYNSLKISNLSFAFDNSKIWFEHPIPGEKSSHCKIPDLDRTEITFVNTNTIRENYHLSNGTKIKVSSIIEGTRSKLNGVSLQRSDPCISLSFPKSVSFGTAIRELTKFQLLFTLAYHKNVRVLRSSCMLDTKVPPEINPWQEISMKWLGNSKPRSNIYPWEMIFTKSSIEKSKYTTFEKFYDNYSNFYDKYELIFTDYIINRFYKETSFLGPNEFRCITNFFDAYYSEKTFTEKIKESINQNNDLYNEFLTIEQIEFLTEHSIEKLKGKEKKNNYSDIVAKIIKDQRTLYLHGDYDKIKNRPTYIKPHKLSILCDKLSGIIEVIILKKLGFDSDISKKILPHINVSEVSYI